MTKTKHKHPQATEYPGSLNEPVALQITASDEEISRACHEALNKLPALAEHFGIDLTASSGPLQLALRLAQEHVPGFRVELKTRTGAPKKKTTQYDMAVAVARELESRRNGERGSAARAAKGIAEIEIAEIAAKAGYRPNKEEIAARARQIENDMSRLNHSALRDAAAIMIGGALAGAGPEEIATVLKQFTQSISHKKPDQK